MARKSSKVDARPAFQFYPKDYRNDQNLAACSLAARGLWMEMLCIMFQAPQRGCLVYLDAHDVVRPVEASRLGRMVGCGVDEIQGLLDELKREGVCSVEPSNGVIYNRRMRAEADQTVQLSTTRSAAGARGGAASGQVRRRESRPENRPVQASRAVAPAVVDSPDDEVASPEEVRAIMRGLTKQNEANATTGVAKGQQVGAEIEAKAKQNGTAVSFHKSQ